MQWYEIHEKLSNALQSFYQDNKGQKKSVGEIFYDQCMEHTNAENKKFNDIFGWSNNITENSIDPFHIFASFNNSGTTMNAKWERVQFYFDVLKIKDDFGNMIDIKKELVDNRFSVPHIAIVYVVADRINKDQQEIWDFFIAVKSKNTKGIKKGFNNYTNWFGIGFTVMTEFLFWIDSEHYISLDKNTSALLRKYNYLIKENYEDYMHLHNAIKDFANNVNIFRVIVEFAYQEKIPEDAQSAYLLHKVLYKSIDPDHSTSEKLFKKPVNFQIIALRVFKMCNTKYSKKLIKNELYKFNKKFKFEHGNTKITFDPAVDIELYNIGDFNLNINVIVGKNGSSKSTLAELIIMLMNNLAIHRQWFDSQQEEEYIPIMIEDCLCADLYFMTDNLYQIRVKNNSITSWKFKQQGNVFSEKIKCDIPKEEIFNSQLFNYSLHSLNSNYFGSWLTRLFHKNDGYLMPITLNPYRANGIIDINIQNKLVKDYLLAHLITSDYDEKRMLAKGLEVKALKISLDEDKLSKYHVLNQTENKQLLQALKIPDSLSSNTLVKKVLSYIFYKYNKIYRTYQPYSRKGMSNNINENFEAINQDTSHKSYKIKRAINFLKYGEFKRFSDNTITELSLTEFANITKRLAKQIGNDVSLLELLPPSIFNIDLIFENGQKFESLSSGEKQKTFVISSILYHLTNLASNREYKYVNIILDEIELYFHPEMQKDFIADLYESIKSNLYIQDALKGLNIILITHSPFILSDVPAENLLLLNEKAEPQVHNTNRTFGANVYDLLQNGFFMDSFIGEFAKLKIQDCIHLIYLYNLAEQNESIEKEVDLLSTFNRIFQCESENMPNDQIRKNILNYIPTLEKNISLIGENIIRNELQYSIQKIKGETSKLAYLSDDDLLIELKKRGLNNDQS